MCLKDVMDDYFNGVRTKPVLKVRNLINYPKNMEEVKRKARGFPLIEKMLTEYYLKLWSKK